MHCARAVHVQIFCTCFCFAVPTGEMVSTADAKLACHICMLPQSLWLPFVWGAGCAHQDRKCLFERGPPVLGNFQLSTPNLVHGLSSISVIRWCMSFGDGVHERLYFRQTLTCRRETWHTDTVQRALFDCARLGVLWWNVHVQRTCSLGVLCSRDTLATDVEIGTPIKFQCSNGVIRW